MENDCERERENGETSQSFLFSFEQTHQRRKKRDAFRPQRYTTRAGVGNSDIRGPVNAI